MFGKLRAEEVKNFVREYYARKQVVEFLEIRVRRLLEERDLLLEHFGLTIEEGPKLVVKKRGQ